MGNLTTHANRRRVLLLAIGSAAGMLAPGAVIACGAGNAGGAGSGGSLEGATAVSAPALAAIAFARNETVVGVAMIAGGGTSGLRGIEFPTCELADFRRHLAVGI